MNKEKCYHMTEALKEITEDEKLEPRVGKNSKHVNDLKNIGISYSLGLEGIIATNAMFRARYQYELLEQQMDRDVTLEDMFSQDVQEQENKALGSKAYLTFDETEKIQEENKGRDIADPKTKSSINLENIKGVILKSNKTGQIKYDRESIIRYAISKTNIDSILNKLKGVDRPFMNMEGYAKTDFSFKEYVKKYYEEMLKDEKMSELKNEEFELEEIGVNELIKIVERDKIKDRKEPQKIAKQDIIKIAKKDDVVMEKENSLGIMKQLEKETELEKENNAINGR